MVELCWVCGGQRILLDFWWFCFCFFYVAPNTVKYSGKKKKKKTIFLEIICI
jgi:hypothetical protein